MDREHAVSENRRPGTLTALIVIVGLEAIALIVATAWLAFEIAVATPESMATAVALAVTCAIAAAGVCWLTVSLVRRRSTVRGAVLVWQLMQGIFARPDIGWALLLPAIIGFVLVLTPSVSAALGHVKPTADER